MASLKRNKTIGYLKCPMCGGMRHTFKIDTDTVSDNIICEDIYCAKKSCPFGVMGYAAPAEEWEYMTKDDRNHYRVLYWNAGVASVKFKKEDFYASGV